MNQKALLYLALGFFAMRWLVREPRAAADVDLLERLRLAGAI